MSGQETNNLRRFTDLQVRYWQLRLQLIDICVRIGNSNASCQIRGEPNGQFGAALQDLNITAKLALDTIKSLDIATYV